MTSAADDLVGAVAAAAQRFRRGLHGFAEPLPLVWLNTDSLVMGLMNILDARTSRTPSRMLKSPKSGQRGEAG